MSMQLRIPEIKTYSTQCVTPQLLHVTVAFFPQFLTGQDGPVEIIFFPLRSAIVLPTLGHPSLHY
jgi:hypothetical protein